MIGICDVSVQAATPNMPLYPLRAFVNSPSSLRIRNVPKRIGDWNISSVQLVVTYPDNTVKTVECKLIGNVWVGTVAGSSITGRCENGYTVFASGNDENGNPVSNYALGKGLVEILEADADIKPGADIKYVRIFDEEPETPKDGDVWQLSGAWYIYQDNQAWPIGDDSGLISQLSSELSTAQQDIESLSANKLETSTFNNFKSDELTAYATQEWTNTQLATKQDALTPAQLSAVDSVVDERATIFDFGNGDISAFNLVGEITQQTMTDLGLYEPYDWIKPPVSVKVGTSVTNIGSYLFVNFPSDFSITLPNTLTAIGDGAFQHVSCLNSIEIPDSVTTMGRDVLFNCSALTDAKIGSSLSSIARNCFERCSSLSTTNIPNNIKTIEIYAFYNSGLTGITIPDSVTNIEDNVFGYCRNLQNVFVGAGVNDIGLSAFDNCDSLSSVVFKGKTLDEVQAMQNYPWGIPSDKLGIISTENIATQEWVTPRLSYSLLSSGSVQLEDRAVQHVSLELSTTVFTLPQLISSKVNDFVLDVTNTYTEGGTPAAASFSLNGTIGTNFNLVVPKDESFAEMTTLEAGEMAEFYFTRTSFELSGLPTWKVVKQVVDQYTPTAI